MVGVAMSSPLLPSDPRVLGRYRTVARIGEGGTL
jgi:hypothetical protein